MNRHELNNVLLEHGRWLESDGEEGKRADLSDADLSYADLSDADLSYANLSYADLFGANLQRADLFGANLSGANLQRASLSGANLLGADLTNVKRNEITAFFDLQCPEKGSFIAYKKCRDDVIVELLIPGDAKRSSATSRKCRCDKAIVLEIVDRDGCQIETAVSHHDGDFVYKVGETVKVDNFNEDRWSDCSTGIHFFITRAEAENY